MTPDAEERFPLGELGFASIPSSGSKYRSSRLTGVSCSCLRELCSVVVYSGFLNIRTMRTQLSSSTVCRSQLDEICLFVQSKI